MGNRGGSPRPTQRSTPLTIVWPGTTYYGTKPGHYETSKIHFPTSEGVSEVSERANERAQRRVRVKRAVRSKRTSERVSERTDERVAQYSRLYSCLFQTTVQRPQAPVLQTCCDATSILRRNKNLPALRKTYDFAVACFSSPNAGPCTNASCCDSLRNRRVE